MLDVYKRQLLQIGHKFFKKVADEAGIALGKEREYGVGMFFFPQEELRRNQAKKLFEIICRKEGLNFQMCIRDRFFTQWSALKTYANEKGVQIIGDLPIYVAADSVDVWASPEEFQLDEDLPVS